MNKFRQFVNKVLGKEPTPPEDPIAAKIEENTCPDCQQTGFLEGPHGGMSVNIMCANPVCGSEFNVASYDGKIVFCDRISSPSPKAPRQ